MGLIEIRESKKNNQSQIIISLFLFVILIFALGTFLSHNNDKGEVDFNIYPNVPKEGVPIIIKASITNNGFNGEDYSYKLYANNQLLTKGDISLWPGSSYEVTKVYPEMPSTGERINFLIEVDSKKGIESKSLSIPAYPPQVWSSFVSFASFSTSLMGSMSSSMGMSISSMQFYNTSFMSTTSPNVGLIFSIVLIGLLIFLELTEPIKLKALNLLGLRLRFSKLSALLFIVFIGMVFTKVVLIVT